MDFVTSVTAAKTGHTAPPGRGGSEADRDASAQIPAFEEEIATLRDLAVEAQSSKDESIPTAQAGLTGDVQAEADVVIDPDAAAALDSSDFDAAVADVTERLGRDAAGEFVAKGGSSAEAVVPLSDVFPHAASVSQAGTQTPSQALGAADVNSVPAPSAGTSAVETPKTGTGEARDPASQSAVLRADTSFTSANSASGAGSARADLPAAATVVRAEDAPTSPLSGQLSAAGVRGATSEQVALATSQRASGEGGADQIMTASKSELVTRASAGPGYMAPVVPRGVPSAATSVPDELPSGSLPTETALRSAATGTGVGPQSAAAQMLASRDGRSDARGTVGPQSVWPRENGLDGVPMRSSSSAQSAVGVEAATQTSGSPLPPALSGNPALSPQAFMPAAPAMAPLFASPGGTVREGTGDATFLGADLAALDAGRAQSGAFPSATAVPAEPRAIVRQIADAMIAAHDNGIDLQLSPEELGRVKLSITPGEGGFLVTVSADRPETLELLRRHIDLLGEEFAALGLGDTAFSFNDPTGHPAQDDEHRSQSDAALAGLGETAEPDTAVPPAPHPRAQSGLLDIRL